MSIVLNQSLRLFLDSIGRRDEYEYYIERFRAPHDGCFALLVPEGEQFDQIAAVLAFDVDFLLRVGLDPAIVLCGPHAGQMAAALTGANRAFRAATLPPSLPPPELLAAASVDVRASRADARVAVLALPKYERREALAALVPGLARRIHYIRVAGPLHDTSGQPLPFYQTRHTVTPPLDVADMELVDEADALLELTPGVHISVASPLQLLEELFTVKGAGCLIRHGRQIDALTDMGQIDRERLVRLIEESFGRPLAEPECLFDAIDCIFLESEYRGAALLRHHAAGAYLSKFAVGQSARGEGLALELWREIETRYPVLFWRARRENAINQWYQRKADGHHRFEDWIVYWRGVQYADIPVLVEYCLDQPNAFRTL